VPLYDSNSNYDIYTPDPPTLSGSLFPPRSHLDLNRFSGIFGIVSRMIDPDPLLLCYGVFNYHLTKPG